MTKSNQKKTALYCRLSQDDNTDGESNSNQNQRRILEQYALITISPTPVSTWMTAILGPAFKGRASSRCWLIWKMAKSGLSSPRTCPAWAGTRAPYGYRKDENDRKKLVVDDEAATIVHASLDTENPYH